MVRAFIFKTLLVTLITIHYCNTKYLLVAVQGSTLNRENDTNFLVARNKMGKLFINVSIDSKR